MKFLEDPFYVSLVARLNQPGVVGLALAGSYSRGTQDQHSDVDVDIFVESLPDETYTLRILDGKLVSLKYILAADEFDSLTKPDRAIWAVAGLQQMQILLDETGQLAKLKQAALDFNWADLQTAANDYAVEELMGCSEEAYKIISGLLQENESKVLYAAWGLFKGLANAVAVQRGMIMESENRYFDIIQETIGHTHAWTRAFRLSFGMDVNSKFPTYQTRGRASLDLYQQTAFLFQNLISDKHREVIENTLQLISSYQQSYQYE
jgi:predicted nucleotidyltransferase